MADLNPQPKALSAHDVVKAVQWTPKKDPKAETVNAAALQVLTDSQSKEGDRLRGASPLFQKKCRQLSRDLENLGLHNPRGPLRGWTGDLRAGFWQLVSKVTPRFLANVAPSWFQRDAGDALRAFLGKGEVLQEALTHEPAVAHNVMNQFTSIWDITYQPQAGGISSLHIQAVLGDTAGMPVSKNVPHKEKLNAAPLAKDAEGNTPVDYAVRFGHLWPVMCLLPCHYATEGHRTDLVNVAIAHGYTGVAKYCYEQNMLYEGRPDRNLVKYGEGNNERQAYEQCWIDQAILLSLGSYEARAWLETAMVPVDQELIDQMGEKHPSPFTRVAATGRPDLWLKLVNNLDPKPWGDLPVRAALAISNDEARQACLMALLDKGVTIKFSEEERERCITGQIKEPLIFSLKIARL